MTASELVAATLLLVPAVVWAIITRQVWAYRSSTAEARPTWTIMALFGAFVVLNNLVHVAWVLLHTDPLDHVRDSPAFLSVPHDISNLAVAALGLHLLRLMPLPERRPGRAWLALVYGPAAVVSVLYAASRLVPGVTPSQQGLARLLYDMCLDILGVCLLWQLVRAARPGAWGPEAAGEVRRSDLKILVAGAAATVLVFLVVAAFGQGQRGLVVLEAGLFLTLAGPWVVRFLGFIIPEFLATAAMLAATALAFWAHAAAAPLLGGRYRPLVDLAAILGLGFFLSSALPTLRAWATRLVLRRSMRQQSELLAFLHTLSPELGVVECCRRALGELVRVRQLRGAAIILRDGEAIVHGSFNLAPLQRVWPRGAAADALPARVFGTVELRALPLQLRDALLEANVGLGAAPILSPRRRWGHLFMNTGLLGGNYREDDFEAFQAFVDQLALLLAGAALLARTVAVERSLAHAEKLAAVGELAARIAHEIRNPVTAARSLAQQLAREPAVPFRDELGVILGELERVERQVASLLRFARQEEFRFAPVDVAELVRGAVTSLRPRLDAAAVELGLDLQSGVVARADPEKLRQVVVNLLENALDALDAAPRPRRIELSVVGENGHAAIGVRDTGPGVPPDALPRLFEPFFSLKPEGTGLGLAIAKRTVDAHGGRITARPGEGGGLRVHVEVPLVGAGA